MRFVQSKWRVHLKTSIRITICITLVAAISSYLMAAGPAIGFAVANGSFKVDNSTISGNASVFDGSTLITERAASKLQLNNGVRLQLGSESRVRVYQDRAILEKGVGQLTASAAYPVEARTLNISSAEPNTVARVQLDGSNSVMVSTVSGAVRVTNAHGVLVANLGAGRAAS